MDDRARRAAAELLREHTIAGTRLPELPEPIRPHSRADGYAIQALLGAQSAHPLFGWKIAATSPAGQAHIAVDGPLAGRILQERVIEAGGTCPFGGNSMKVAELEFAFRLTRTLTPGAEYQIDEVLDAVGSLHLAIEIPDSRYDVFTRVGAPQLIADNACANYFVVGPAAPETWRELDLSRHEVAGFVSGGPPERGSGANVLGDPRIALTWLVDELSRHGIPLAAGAVVSTGTCVVPMAIAPGDHVRGDFGSLGEIEVWIGT